MSEQGGDGVGVVVERAAIRVIRNPSARYFKTDEKPWLVTCDHCGGGRNSAGMFDLLFDGTGSVKGWAPTWSRAQEYAVAHAAEHEAARCPTCHHTPALAPAPTSPGASA